VDVDGNVTYIFDTINKDDKEARILLSRLADKDDLDVAPDHVDSGHKNYKGDVVDLTPYMYQNITVYEKDDVVVFVSDVNSLVFKGTVVESTTGGQLVVEDAKEDEYDITKVTSSTAVFLNGAEVRFDKFDLEDAEVTVVLKGEDGDRISKSGVTQDVVGIVARLATMTVIAVEDFDEAEEEILADDYNVVLPLDDDEIDYDRVVVKGAVDSLEDIEEDDVLTLFYAGGKADDDVKLEIIVSRDTVEGRLTRISGSDYTVGGKVYKLTKGSLVEGELTAGDEGLFYLDYEGKIFAFDEEGSDKPGNYALVLDVTDGYQTTSGGVILADPKVKLLTASGEEITYVLDEDVWDVKLLDKTTPVVSEVNVNDLVVKLTEGDVIEYDLDKNNVIDELEVVNMGNKLIDLKTDVNSFNLASNAVIFNVPGGGVDDAEVIDADELDDKIDAYRFRNTKGEIEVLVVIKGGAEVDNIYALITKDDNDNNRAWDEDEEDDVLLYTAYVDGEKVEYLKHKDNETAIEKGKDIYKLTISGGKLKAADKITVTTPSAFYGTASDSRVTNSITDKNNPEKVYFLADDVVIYVFKANGDFDKVGTKSDIRNKQFAVYDVVDSDKDFDIVVVWP
jgi:hypothetical protein